MKRRTPTIKRALAVKRDRDNHHKVLLDHLRIPWLPDPLKPNEENLSGGETWLSYIGGLSPELVQSIMKLPQEIRDKIYGHLTYSLQSKREYPETNSNRSAGWPGIARRNDKFPWSDLKLAPKLDDSEKKKYWLESEAYTWKNKRGKFNYFEGMEYHNLRGFITALQLSEGYKVSGVVSRNRSFALTGILEDFLQIYWKAVILDFGFPLEQSTGSSCNDAKLKDSLSWLNSHHSFDTRIQNISLNFTPNTTYKYFHPILRATETHCLNRDFRVMCTHITKYFTNLQNITLWIQMTVVDVEKLLDGHGKEPREWTQRWIESLRRLPAGKSFDLQLAVEFDKSLGDENRLVEDDNELAKDKNELKNHEKQQLQDQYQERLQKLLLPYSLAKGTTGDVEDDLGLGKLF